MNLGLRLSMVRKARHLRQKTLAKDVGISPKHLSQLENGQVSVENLRAGVVANLARILEVSTDYLLGLTDESDISMYEPAMPVGA